MPSKSFYWNLARLCLLSLCLCLQARATNIVAEPAAGCAPLIVHLHPDLPACPGCTYSWNFGTGSPVSGYEVSSSFLTTGAHVVTLTVTNGSTIEHVTLAVTVSPTPSVSFSGTDTAYCPGGTTVFNSTSTPGSPGAYTTSWSFGDSVTASGTTASHTYTHPGYYNVTLFVTNSQGCTGTLVAPNYVHVFAPPVPHFSFTPFSICNPPGEISFSNTSTGTPPLSYTWNLGDGVTSTATNPANTYSTSGTWYPSLAVTDGNGCASTLNSPTPLHVGSVSASFSFPDSICVYKPTTLSNMSSAHTFRTWDYGDGSTGNSYNGEHTWHSAGAFPVTLVVGNSPCADTLTQIVHVVSGPPGRIIISPSEPCPARTWLTYSTDAPPGTVCYWYHYPEDTMQEGNPATYEIKVNHNRLDTLIKESPVTGCRDTVVQRDTVYDMFLDVNHSSFEGCVPLTVSFSAAAYTFEPDGAQHPYPYALTPYNWFYGDGSSGATGTTTTHTFTAVGTYTTVVSTHSGNGCDFSREFVIKVGTPPEATFTASPQHLCYKKTDSIDFVATQVVGPIDSLVWDFGDNSKSDTDLIYRYAYDLPGTWTVTVTPYYNGCKGDSFVRENYITIDSAKAIMQYEVLCTSANEVIFGDSSLGADSRLWIFGDGTTSSDKELIHSFPDPISYVVKLTTYNSGSGCRDTTSAVLDLQRPVPDFAPSQSEFCAGDSCTILASYTGGIPFLTRWFINGDSAGVNGPVFTQTFPTRGVYTVTLVITGTTGCVDTLIKPDIITVSKPDAGFYRTPATPCAPLEVALHDSSTDAPGVTMSAFSWDFGDGATATTTDSVTGHTFLNPGVYQVTEVVTSSIGCTDTVHGSFALQRPVAMLTLSNQYPCPGDTVHFFTNPAGTVSRVWDFGDGNTASTPTSRHVYNDTGAYDLTLSVTDSSGCADTIIYPAYIRVTKPTASFTVSDSIALCVPFFVQFYNSSTGASGFSWDFGDGNSSLVPSPTNYYTSPGEYFPRCIVNNIHGCRDTTSGHISIHDYGGVFSYPVDSGCAPLTVLFSASLTNVPSVTWDFADGVTITVAATDTISHTYLYSGGYVPKLVLGSNAGCHNSSVGSDTIKVSSVHAHFGTVPSIICVDSPFHFSDSSTSSWVPVSNYWWSFDGTTSTAPSPLHAFTVAGTYPVTEVVTNTWGCTDTTHIDVIIPGIASITGDTLLCSGETVMLTDITAGGSWTSASPSIASVDASGIVTGIAQGTTNITYGTDGCFATHLLSVQQTPPAISGAAELCEGDTTTLSNAVMAGTWSSSNTAVATVNPVSGKLTGITPGTATISYTKGECFVTTTVSVHPSPGPITGDSVLCLLDSTVLVSSPAAGTWSSSDETIITIGIATGKVQSIAPGTSVISYTLGICSSTYAVTVNNEIPSILGPAIICEGAGVHLSDSLAGGIWVSNDTSIVTIDSLTGYALGHTAGTVRLTYFLDGCFTSDTLIVHAPPDPGEISVPERLCVGDTVIISASVTGGDWLHTNVITGTLSDTNSYTAFSAGYDTLLYIVSDSSCSDTATHAIRVFSLPSIDITNAPSSLCIGSSASITFTSSAPGIWNSSAPTVAQTDSLATVITALSTGITTLSFITHPDSNGCFNDTTIQLSVIPAPFSISAEIQNPTCYGGHDGAISVHVSGATAPVTYHWASGTDSSQLLNLLPGQYILEVTQPSSGCVVSDSFQVVQPDSMYLQSVIQPDTCNNGKGSIELYVTGGTLPYTYQWNNGPRQLSRYDVRPGLYTIEITDAHNCRYEHTVLVPNAACSDIILHDVITPNGDGVNDNWVVENLSQYPKSQVQIFDKWGDLVYEYRGYTNQWHGQGKGGDLPDGTYYFVVQLNEPNRAGGETTFTGTVLIKR